MEYIEDEIMKRLSQLTSEELSKDSVIEDLDIDSLDLVELVTELEDAYSIEISDEELLAIKTIGDILDLVQDKVL